jgi:hypothetical protein
MTIIQKTARLLVLSLCPAVGLFFFYHQYERPNIKSSADITFVEGQIKDYFFTYKGGGRASSRKFYIWLQGYDCTFQIAADYLSSFEKKKFEKTLEVGDSIRIGVPNEEKENLNKDEKILTMSIDGKQGNYLAFSDVLEEENNYFDIYFGFLFLGFGYGFYLLEKKGIIQIK